MALQALMPQVCWYGVLGTWYLDILAFDGVIFFLSTIIYAPFYLPSIAYGLSSSLSQLPPLVLLPIKLPGACDGCPFYSQSSA